jgi:glyoxylase-like metal-dependent hydrolase (beta-lactamase superfamily II)
MRPRARWLVPTIGLLLVAAGMGACATGGHLVRAEFAAQHAATFDFSRPPCPPAAAGPARADEVVLRYLGTGGLYVEWRGEAVLFAPFFSNPSLVRVLAGGWQPDPAAIEDGLRGLPLERVRAVFVGHTHYDHFAELPWFAPRTAPGAPIYVNRSGTRMLAAYPELAARAVSLDSLAAGWVELPAADGGPRLWRFRALPSAHAPHVDHYLWGRGEVEAPWREPWTERPLRHFVAGGIFAFVVDLLAPETGETAFRLYFGDAAAPAGQGYPPAEVDGDGHAFDLAALCVPNYYLVTGYPEGILERLRPSHVLAVHYEDFFRSRSRPLRFVPYLSDGRVERFLGRVRDGVARGGQATRGPVGRVCGPSSAASTMPLPGEWLRFAVLE